MILDPNEYRFTFGEVVGESNVDATNLRNWMAREVVPVGQKHKLGRWLFSIADIVRFRTVRSLTMLTDMPPLSANRLAEPVVRRLFELVSPGENGDYPNLAKVSGGALLGRHRIVLMLHPVSGLQTYVGRVATNGQIEFMEKGKHLAYADGLEELPHTIFPMDELIASAVMQFTVSAFEEDGGDWKTRFPDEKGRSKFEFYTDFECLAGMVAWYSEFRGGENV
ncbi:MerR family transcriptional regulator [Shinella sp.]|uniref:MerR family transcriptional regulator n=1 Tax=Shinella sp. TaxID=1870904 RepID=UPI0029ADE224|nr:MerR family transcriptional regulator [Shinella sp.]MDX3975800.1 MerR family transcriptional regulator [Shinella sp.]